MCCRHSSRLIFPDRIIASWAASRSYKMCVVGGIAPLTKLGVDEMQHRNMKAKTNPANSCSTIRILPDLVRFEGFMRIHRVHGDIVCPVPVAAQKADNPDDANHNHKDSDSAAEGDDADETKPAASKEQSHNPAAEHGRLDGCGGQVDGRLGSHSARRVQLWLVQLAVALGQLGAQILSTSNLTFRARCATLPSSPPSSKRTSSKTTPSSSCSSRCPPPSPRSTSRRRRHMQRTRWR